MTNRRQMQTYQRMIKTKIGNQIRFFLNLSFLPLVTASGPRIVDASFELFRIRKEKKRMSSIVILLVTCDIEPSDVRCFFNDFPSVRLRLSTTILLVLLALLGSFPIRPFDLHFQSKIPMRNYSK